jgi:hypothetical protein
LPEGYNFNSIGRTIVAPSPALLSVPVEISDASAIYQFVVYPLATLMLTDVIDRHPQRWEVVVFRYWRFVVEALRLWELWEDDGPLAVGRADIVRWLYQNAQAAPMEARKAIPGGYARLCRTYRVWGLAPTDMAIPLYCSDLDENQGLQQISPKLPIRLGWLTFDANYQQERPLDPPTKTVGAETVIEYIVATYGRDHLPHLIAALGDHASWKTLIPAVFGVSAREFEAGWQTYLAMHYGVDEAR